MASPPLVIRNLTSVPIRLTVVEHIEATGSQSKSRIPGGFATGLDAITQGVSDLITNNTSVTPEGPHIAPDATSFKTVEQSIEVQPFELKKTEVKPTIKSENEVIRLTFEAQGQKYKIVCPSPKDESQSFNPVAQNPKLHLTGVFLPQVSQLTVYSSANLNSWMQHLSDDLPLSALSIPGTHDSPTCYKALPSVRCQAVPPREQLENGVRFLDIRVQPEDVNSDKLQLVHGVFPISLTGPKYFRDLINDTVDFLDKNPSETVILSLKREGTGNMTDQQLARILFDHYCGPKDGHRWYTKPKIPTLGQARNKIVLFRRFGYGDDVHKALGADSTGWGINAETWADNTPCDTHGMVCVQDFYEVLETENIDKKITYAKDHCKLAGKCSVTDGPGGGGGPPGGKPHFYVNFLSASNFWKSGCWPEKIAAKLNPAMVEYLCVNHHLDYKEERGDGGTGIVVLDWVGYQGDWDLVRCIVGMNAKLERDMK